MWKESQAPLPRPYFIDFRCWRIGLHQTHLISIEALGCKWRWTKGGWGADVTWQICLNIIYSTANRQLPELHGETTWLSNPWEETQHSSLDSDRVCRSDSVRYGSWETTAIIMRFWSVWTDCSDGERVLQRLPSVFNNLAYIDHIKLHAAGAQLESEQGQNIFIFTAAKKL